MLAALVLAATQSGAINFLLWLVAVVCVITGIVRIFQGAVLWGVVLIVVGVLIGPGGYSIFG